MPAFVVGQEYALRELRQVLGLPEEATGGAWFRGYERHGDAFHVFATVRSRGGRAQAERRDHWEGALLCWSAKGRARIDDPSIQRLVGGTLPVHVFWRTEDGAPFTYAGEGVVKEARDTVPATVVWECSGRSER
jgi:hypothetical protein